MVLFWQHFRYLHKADTIVFTIVSTIKQAKFDLSRTIITEIILFGCVIYSLAYAHCYQSASAEEEIMLVNKLALPIMVREE